MNETSLGLTLMILTVIAGQEISHLVHPFAAMAVTLVSPLLGPWAAK